MYNSLFDENRQNAMRDYFLNNLGKKGIIRKYSRNEIIELHSDDYFGIVVKGIVSINVLNSNGNEKMLYVLRPGEIFEEMNYFCGGSKLTVARVKENAEVSIIYKNVLEPELADNPEAYRYFLHSVTRKYRIVMLQMTNSVFNDSIGKIADTLLRMASCSIGTGESEKIIIDTPFTHQELANNIGCSRITVTKFLNKFIDEGIIIYEDKRIVIKNREALKQYINVIEE
ncbi:Crp/Fnr family transcriptional regulator [Clostridium omnivorum]|uniref:CarD family transcriptional regulator n=1 Tax=Clostridium omnivorum TaxID=1604902 RepID=A0ABQ5N689_9CLOT|nr:Crp/Fnr family transcriptional regulator [Clostridium sp. E14]GLC30718.1 CarD family transcriptional regulator [Clostridium sp. E14]